MLQNPVYFSKQVCLPLKWDQIDDTIRQDTIDCIRSYRERLSKGSLYEGNVRWFEVFPGSVLTCAGNHVLGDVAGADQYGASGGQIYWIRTEDRSSPMTWPVGPTLSAARRTSIPPPEPKSTMVSP
jgi:hypothetical protein